MKLLHLKYQIQNASGYNFDYDDEDDDSSTDHLEPISLNNVNATSKQTTSYKYKEPAQRVTTNTVKKKRHLIKRL